MCSTISGWTTPSPWSAPGRWRICCTAPRWPGGATILHGYFHPFAPCGVTGFLLLAESHLSVHTWPEEGFAAFDIFSCGDMDTDAIVDTIRETLRPARERLQLIHRGSGEGEGGPSCPR